MSERLRSVVEQLDVRPDDRVLEIGCGTESWRRTFASGSKRDISPRSTARRRWFKPRRNAAYVEAGRAEFLVSTLEDLDLGDRRFDKVFAVRVGHFHRDPERARGIVER